MFMPRAVLVLVHVALLLSNLFKHATGAVMVKKKKKKPRNLPVAEVQPWFSRKPGNGPPPLSPGQNCLAILNVGLLRTFNWPGVWQSQAARLPHGAAVDCVDHFLCISNISTPSPSSLMHSPPVVAADSAPNSASPTSALRGEGWGHPAREAVAAMGLRVLRFHAPSQLERCRQCWLRATFERQKAGLAPYAWFLRTRPDIVFFNTVPWPPWDPAANPFVATLPSPDAAVYAPLTDARNLPALLRQRRRSSASAAANTSTATPRSTSATPQGTARSSSSFSSSSAAPAAGLPEVWNTDFVSPHLPCCHLMGQELCDWHLRLGGLFEAGASVNAKKKIAARQALVQDRLRLMDENAEPLLQPRDLQPPAGPSFASGDGGDNGPASWRSPRPGPATPRSSEQREGEELIEAVLGEVSRPCATVSDQLAVVPARFARAYFDPASVVKVKNVESPSPKAAVPPESDPAWAQSKCAGWIEGTGANKAAAERTSKAGSWAVYRASEAAKKGKMGSFLTPEGLMNYALATAGAEVRPLGAAATPSSSSPTLASAHSNERIHAMLFTIDPRRLRAFDEKKLGEERSAEWYAFGPRNGDAPRAFGGSKMAVTCEPPPLAPIAAAAV